MKRIAPRQQRAILIIGKLKNNPKIINKINPVITDIRQGAQYVKSDLVVNAYTVTVTTTIVVIIAARSTVSGSPVSPHVFETQ